MARWVRAALGPVVARFRRRQWFNFHDTRSLRLPAGWELAGMRIVPQYEETVDGTRYVGVLNEFTLRKIEPAAEATLIRPPDGEQAS